MEVECSALLLSHAWPTLPHFHKRSPTLNYFCTWKMLCKRGVGAHTVDIGVVVLAVASFSKIAPDELWADLDVKSSF